MRFESVRKRRLHAGLPVAALAQVAGRTIGWVYSLERGLVAPCRADAQKIADLLDADVDQLFSRIREEQDAT